MQVVFFQENFKKLHIHNRISMAWLLSRKCIMALQCYVNSSYTRNNISVYIFQWGLSLACFMWFLKIQAHNQKLN